LNAHDRAFIAVPPPGEEQAEARSIVLAQPATKDVGRELNRESLTAHGIEVPQK
jgi:hypothetical protein